MRPLITQLAKAAAEVEPRINWWDAAKYSLPTAVGGSATLSGAQLLGRLPSVLRQKTVEIDPADLDEQVAKIMKEMRPGDIILSSDFEPNSKSIANKIRNLAVTDRAHTHAFTAHRLPNGEFRGIDAAALVDGTKGGLASRSMLPKVFLSKLFGGKFDSTNPKKFFRSPVNSIRSDYAQLKKFTDAARSLGDELPFDEMTSRISRSPDLAESIRDYLRNGANITLMRAKVPIDEEQLLKSTQRVGAKTFGGLDTVETVFRRFMTPTWLSGAGSKTPASCSGAACDLLRGAGVKGLGSAAGTLPADLSHTRALERLGSFAVKGKAISRASRTKDLLLAALARKGVGLPLLGVGAMGLYKAMNPSVNLSDVKTAG